MLKHNKKLNVSNTVSVSVTVYGQLVHDDDDDDDVYVGITLNSSLLQPVREVPQQLEVAVLLQASHSPWSSFFLVNPPIHLLNSSTWFYPRLLQDVPWRDTLGWQL